MGWDAFARLNGKRLKVRWMPSDENERRIIDESLHKAFMRATKNARRKVNEIDWLLPLGGLDCSDCANALQAATGGDVYAEHGWSPKEVRKLWFEAVWPEDRNWACVCAYYFLKTCVNYNLGVEFSW